MVCTGAFAISSGCAPRCSTGSKPDPLLPLETERATSSTARQEDFCCHRRRDTAQRDIMTRVIE